MLAALSLAAFLLLANPFDGVAGAPAVRAVQAQSSYLLGLGIGDITGPVVETNQMGYASLSQVDSGVHMRQRSRAYIVADPTNDKQRILFINSDIAMGDTAVRRGVLQAISAKYPGYYSESNVAMVGTHQHSGVGGYLQNLLPQITSLGFVRQTYQAIVDGTVLAVDRAHNSMFAGTLSLGNKTLLDTNINRSPYAYLANPAAERAQYQYDQDKDFTLLKFTGSDGVDHGFLSFFAVHGTSIYENNTLVSTDNKGYAAYLYETYKNPDAMPGNNSFIAGFVQSNVGDTSPNTVGAWCESPGQPWDGKPCDFATSTCGPDPTGSKKDKNTTADCHGHGPGFRQDAYGFASNTIIGTNQYNAAKSLMEGGSLKAVSGAVKSLHMYQDMTNYTFPLPNGTTVHTCLPAMGYSFAGGTTDGPGAFDFTQGDNTSQPQNPFWELVKNAVTPPPTPEQQACQNPKPILLNTGAANTPYQWTPHIVDIQMLRVGQLVMLVMPAEFTTMAGRRIRNAVRAQLIAQNIIDSSAYVVIAGPANTYSHYTTTEEEYGVQRYEGASTIYGQWTLQAYTNLYTGLVKYLAAGSTDSPPAGPTPPDLTQQAISLQTPVVQDNAPIGKSFGSVVTDVSSTITYHAGNAVSVVFNGANPRNNLRLEGTFMTVQTLSSGAWKTVRTDSQPSTTYQWTRTNTVLGYSTVNLTWTIEQGTPAGTYRFQYFGDSKFLLGGAITPFSGVSGNFTVG